MAVEQRVIETVLLEQQDELAALRETKLITRREESKINLKSKLAQVVIGVRRSGKSTLCFHALERAGVPYAYVNFDDERFANMQADDLDNVLTGLYRIYGKFDYLFLDEVQNIDGWPLFVNRLLRQGLHLIVTGSNSKLLSTELASHLTGRHHKIELFPFSFLDCCEIQGVEYKRLTTKNKGLLLKAFDEYIRNGGFPELLFEEDKKEYINTLFHNIIEQDIRKRFHVRNTDELVKMANHLLNEAPALIVKETLEQVCGIKSDHTVVKYLSYLEQTYLISTISKYSVKSRQRARNEKYYAIDVALMDKRENALVGENVGWRLETLVYLELRRRYAGQDVFYYKDDNTECDFVVCEGNRAIAAYQVSYDISNPKTRTRELRGCKVAMQKLHCNEVYLLTMNETLEVQTEQGIIHILPAWEWMITK